MKTKLQSEWETVELGDVIVCLDGERIPLNSEERSKMKGNIPYYGANGQIDSINKHIFNEELLLLAEDGGSWGPHQKCSYIINGKSWVNNHAHVLKMKKGTDISYLMYFLNHHDLNQFISGTTRGKLNQGVMKKIPIILPPLHIQKQIVSLLEKAEKLKEMRDEANKLRKEYLKAVFLEMFGDPARNTKKWKTYTIREVSNKISDGPFGSNLKTEHYSSKGVRVIRLKNIGVERWIDDDQAFIPEKHYDTIKNHTCEPGDVIVGTMGDPNLRACILPLEIKIAVNKADCIQIKPNKKLINSQYLCSLINQPSFVSNASGLMHGQTRTRISMSQVASLKIPLPPIDLQNKFTYIVNEIEKLVEYQKQSKDNIVNLFNKLKQKSFRGELAC